MKLYRAHIQNFRSIVDSGEVEIEDQVTVFIGKNEQGKTTFLKALATFSSKNSYSPNDLPNHLRPKLDSQNQNQIPVVTIWLTVGLSDIASLKPLTNEPDKISALKITKFFDGHKSYSVLIKDGNEEPLEFAKPDINLMIDEIKASTLELRNKLEEHAKRQQTFAPHLPQANALIDQFMGSNFSEASQIENLIGTLFAGLTSIPGQDAAIQEEVVSVTKKLKLALEKIKKALEVDLLKKLEDILPKFVYHSTALDRIPNEINVADFIGSPEAISRGMYNLCRVAGLSMQKIQELSNTKDNSYREGYEDHYKLHASGGINEFWTQQKYDIHFRFEAGRMSVSISDGTYSPRIAPSDRSEGFQWYLSFYSTMLSEVSNTEPVVFLLDNPGIELHSDGQMDIKRFLEEKLRSNAQILYVTHSPAMVDPFNLEQVRQIELKPNQQGTKIGKLDFKNGTDFDLLEPIRTAIGASLASSLLLGKLNVLVEGAADKPILEAAFALSNEEKQKKIVVNGSVAENNFLVDFYKRSHLPFIVYLDNDSSGRKIKSRLENSKVESKHIINLEEIFPDRKGQDFELEDIVSSDMYHKAVLESYPDTQCQKPDKPSGKITRIYDGIFKEKFDFGFNKHRVALQLKKMICEGKADDETSGNLALLTKSILANLEGQISN